MDFQASDAAFQSRASDRKNAELTTFEAVKAQVTAFGEDAELLTCPPFFKASIRKHSDQEKLMVKKLLADKIRIGDIEDEAGMKSPLWAYLADNTFTNRLTELVYFSTGRSNKRATRHTADDAHGGLLREEFMHCETPSALTATAKLYLYRKGISTAFPVEISKYLAREMTRACKAYTDKNTENPKRALLDDHTDERDAMEMAENKEEGREVRSGQQGEPDLPPQVPTRIQTLETRTSSTAGDTNATGFQNREHGQHYDANAGESSSSLDVGRSNKEPTQNTVISDANINPQAHNASSVSFTGYFCVPCLTPPGYR